MSDKDRRVWITQLLCEHRHCMYACAWEDEHERPPPEALKRAEELIDGQGSALGVLGFGVKRCRVCLSENLHIEHGRTGFTSIKEAAPVLHVMEALNIASGDLLEQLNAAKRKGSH